MLGWWSLVRGIDFLARHAHHESFEYPSGSYEGGVIQRPWRENCSDDSQSDISGDDSPSSSPAEKEALQTQEKLTEKWKGGSKDMGLRGSTLATSGTGWQGGSEALYPYLVVCSQMPYSEAYTAVVLSLCTAPISCILEPINCILLYYSNESVCATFILSTNP